MTATIMETDTETVELTEHEFDTPCDVGGCGHAATWHCLTKCCGTAWFFCDDCMEFVKRFDALSTQVWECEGCDNSILAPIILSCERL